MLRKPVLWTLLLIGIAASTVSRAQSDASDATVAKNQENLWVPSVAFALDVHDERGDLAGTNDSPGLNFNLDSTESKTVVGLRLGLELMSPTLPELPFKPRFFLSGGALFATPSNGVTESRDNARTKDDFREVGLQATVEAQNDKEKSDPTTPPVPFDDKVLFEGQGNLVNSEQLNNAWFISMGAAFTYPQSGFSIRVRPSFEYLLEKIKTRGEFILVTVDSSPTVPLQEIYTLHRASLNGDDTFHSIGPGLEVEFINHLDGNLTLSLFTQVRVMWAVNSTKTVVSGLAGNTSGGANPITAQYSFDRDPMSIRGGIGIRLGWKKLAFDF